MSPFLQLPPRNRRNGSWIGTQLTNKSDRRVMKQSTEGFLEKKENKSTEGEDVTYTIRKKERNIKLVERKKEILNY